MDNEEKVLLVEEEASTEEQEVVTAQEDDDDDDSSLGFVAFLASVLGLAVFGIIFGFVHLASKQQKYRKLAVAGIVISTVSYVTTTIILAWSYSMEILSMLMNIGLASGANPDGFSVLLILVLVLPVLVLVFTMFLFLARK